MRCRTTLQRSSDDRRSRGAVARLLLGGAAAVCGAGLLAPAGPAQAVSVGSDSWPSGPEWQNTAVVATVTFVGEWSDVRRETITAIDCSAAAAEVLTALPAQQASVRFTVGETSAAGVQAGCTVGYSYDVWFCFFGCNWSGPWFDQFVYSGPVVRVDTTPPTLTPIVETAPVGIGDELVVHPNASDATSGVDEAWCDIGGHLVGRCAHRQLPRHRPRR